ncbi:MAG TPA: HD domain-containing protein [Candidatus Limnocylindrales bacterium]
MSVPGRVEAASLLRALDPPTWFLRHSRAVAEIAGWLALRIALEGLPIDRRLVESAALLHDVDKILPPDDPARRLPHGEGSAAWLERRGHAELAAAAAGHPVTRLVGRAGQSALVRLEDRVVAYADKRAGQRLESLDARFRSWARRYPAPSTAIARAGHPPEGGRDGNFDAGTVGRMRVQAERLERAVCDVAQVQPHEVRRLAWTGAALRAAAAIASVGASTVTASRSAT